MYIQVKPWTHSHGRRTIVRLGLVNDRVDFISFLLNLPLRWFGCFNQSKAIVADPPPDGTFSFRLDIFNPEKTHTFTVYFDDNFIHPVVYAMVNAFRICSDTFPLWSGHQTIFLLSLRQEAMVEVRQYHQHPYTILAHKISGQRLHSHADGTMQISFDHVIAEQVAARVLRDQASKNFAEAIASIKGRSSLYITTCTNTGKKLLSFSDGRTVFRMVSVLEHGVAVLKDHPSCVMTDGTFRILNPYVLEILNVVIANEAIPIAFCMTPSSMYFRTVAVFQGTSQLLIPISNR
jgi:hypothetical protein